MVNGLTRLGILGVLMSTSYLPSPGQQDSKNLEDITTNYSIDDTKNTFENVINYNIPSNPLNLDSRYKYNEKDLEKYNNWVDKTITESSQQNKNSIIVDKSAYTLYLIKKGEIHSKYPVELGGNPFDDKRRRGDQCTPEGLYKIDWKRDVGQTAFYRAFLLNYPNAEDKKNNKTGSHIEIHGSGTGKHGNKEGFNWTLGCMALSNKDIDNVFPYVGNGSKITIVKYTDRFLDSEKHSLPAIIDNEENKSQIHPAKKVTEYVLRNFEDTEEFREMKSFYKNLQSDDGLVNYQIEVIVENDTANFLGIEVTSPINYLKIEDSGINGLIPSESGTSPDIFSFSKGKVSFAKSAPKSQLMLAEKLYKKNLTDILDIK